MPSVKNPMTTGVLEGERKDQKVRESYIERKYRLGAL